MPHLQAADVTFLQLQSTVFCVSCELISYNNSSKCLACSSTALLSLSRVLGGSIREHERARVVGDELIDRVVEDILERNVHTGFVAEGSTLSLETDKALVGRALTCRTLPNALPQLQPAMRWIVERACTITRADGAALALSRRGKLVCHAHAGLSPDLGIEIDVSRGLSGLCAHRYELALQLFRHRSLCRS